MKYSPPLTAAKLVKRYKRFLADVVFDDGSENTAHCANTGSMKGLALSGSTVYLSANTNPKAKLDWRWELEDLGSTFVGINTNRANAIAEEAIQLSLIPELQGYGNLKREVKYGGNSRIDILLSEPENTALPALCYVEVKSVTLAEGNKALFPDAVTKRGTKHLNELIDMVGNGHRAVMLFLIQRSDCKCFSPADNIDPEYGQTLRRAHQAGVELVAYDCTLSSEGIIVKQQVKIHL